MWGSLRRPLLAGLCFALVSAPCALAGTISEKPDIEDRANPVQGDWVRPADIVYVGDSESLGYFGDDLYRDLSAQRDPRTGRPLRVWTYWTCGSDATTWLMGGTTFCGIRSCDGAGQCARDHGPNDGPAHVKYAPLRRYLGEIKPRLTIVSLGTNIMTTHDFDRPAVYQSYLFDVGELIGEIKAAGSRCIWIGPPEPALSTRSIAEYRRLTGDLARIAKAGGCDFVDSDPLSDRAYVLKRDSEGIHYRSEGEKAWEAKLWPVIEPLVMAGLKG